MNVKEAIALAAHVVGKGSTTLPILSYLRFANGRIMASDLAQQIDIPMELPVGVRKADFCVHASRLLRVLSALPPELELNLEHAKKRLVVSAGPTRYELGTLPAEDYPQMAADDDRFIQVQAPSKDLVAGLAFVAKAMAVNDIRYYLNGVHFQLAAGKLVLTATDGHRVHRARIALTDAEVKEKADGIIAAPSVARVIEVAERHTDVGLELGRTRFNVIDRELLHTKLIDGRFPDADRVIPADRPSTGGLPRQPFLAAVRRVAQILAGDKLNGIRFAFSPAEVALSAQNTDKDSAAERFAWNAADQKFTGIELGMAWEYVAGAFDAMKGDWVFVHLPSSPDQSVYFTDGSDREVVIMPMRI